MILACRGVLGNLRGLREASWASPGSYGEPVGIYLSDIQTQLDVAEALIKPVTVRRQKSSNTIGKQAKEEGAAKGMEQFNNITAG